MDVTFNKSPFYNEMYAGQDNCRSSYQDYKDWLTNQTHERLEQKREQANFLFQRMGITFNVYSEGEGAERLIPFDIIPRIISASEWDVIDRGVRQRAQALNAFLKDIYHAQSIIKEGIIPAEQVFANDQYQPCMQGLKLYNDAYVHISGTDIVRDGEGDFYVLEDNLRTPSGVSYMIENRKMMMRLFPELFAKHPIAPIDHYPSLLLKTLKDSTPVDNPCVILLTPGRFNSAYYEHAFLAQEMGIELAEGADLFVKRNQVYMRTTQGPKRVDVIYRRIDDGFLDPLCFNPESMLGVPGLVSAYRSGNVIVANAVGTGVGDDKSIYPYVPEMIRFYLDQEPILKNVPTYMCRKPKDLQYTLDNIKDLVVKEVHGSGGYGMLIGPKSSSKEIEEFVLKIKAKPDNYIAQPTLALSTSPTLVEEGVAPRHIDFRPFLLNGKDIHLVPGGLTRVALNKGSLVVNSSQGGGTKDSWILEDTSC